MDAVEELRDPKVPISHACVALGLSRATLYRQTQPAKPPVVRPRAPSPRRLSDLERRAVLDVLHTEEFVDQPPAEVHARLLSRGVYLASLRTMYRLLAASGETGERRAQRGPMKHAKPTLEATAPNQVWTWDITKLRGVQHDHHETPDAIRGRDDDPRPPRNRRILVRLHSAPRAGKRSAHGRRPPTLNPGPTSRTMTPTAPILLFCTDGLMFFDDVDSAESYMEGIDVKNGEYLAAYDSRGLRLKIEGDAKEHKLLGIRFVESSPVRLLPGDPSPHPSELENRLRQSLIERGLAPSLVTTTSLPDLLTLARE